MVTAKFEHDGNVGILYFKDHFGQELSLHCEKRDDEIFRLGGTAANEVVTYEGVILELTPNAPFRAFRTEQDYFESTGILSEEGWTDADLHCYVTEYYPLDMEGKKHSWFISKNPIQDAHYLFVNLDVLDGGGNLVRRYRVSPFTGEHMIMEY